MSQKLFVGNLSFSMTKESLIKMFEGYGDVNSANIITDRDTGRSKGFAFVEMSTSEEANDAISALHGSSVEGRPMIVNEAKPQAPR